VGNELEARVEREQLEGILPILRGERIWGFFALTEITIGLAIATWCFLIGGTTATFVNLRMGAAAALGGNLIAVAIVAFSATTPSYRYGVEQFLLLRSTFGHRGTFLPMGLAQFIWIAWSAVLMIMLGKVFLRITGALTPVAGSDSLITTGAACAGLALCWLVLTRGVTGVERLNRFVAPGLAVIMVAILVIIWREIGFRQMFDMRPRGASQDRWFNYVVAIELNLGAGFGWWPFLGNLARLAKTRRAAFWPSLIGLALFASLGTISGLIAGLRFGSSDPTTWMIPLAGTALGVVILVFIGLGNVTATVLTGYVACMSLKQTSAMNRWKWRTVTTVFMIPCFILLAGFAQPLYNNFGSLLSLTGLFMAPLAAVYAADYFILKRKHFDLWRLYGISDGKKTTRNPSINMSAIVAVLVGVVLSFFIFNPLSFHAAKLFRYTTASIPSAGIVAIVYLLLEKRRGS